MLGTAAEVGKRRLCDVFCLACELGVVEVRVGAFASEQLEWLPCSTIRPPSMTRIVSASRIVESRCAMTKLVRCDRRAAIACWISTSVRVSTELVASSRMRIGRSARNARAIVISCRSPALTELPIVVEDRVVAVRQRVDEAVDVRRARRLQDLFLRRLEVAVGDVLADGAAEEPGVLEDHADLRPQLAAWHLRDVAPVNRDRAAIELVEAHDQVDERRLAGARRADDGDRAARFCDE